MAKGKWHEWLTEEGLILVKGWATDGLTYEQIAHNMGISKDTLYEWMKRFPDFSDALKRSRAVADRHVENALFKSAVGFKYDEVTCEKDKESGEMIETKRVTKEVLPNPTSIIFWLKNRKPAEWRDKKDVAVEGGLPIVIADNVHS